MFEDEYKKANDRLHRSAEADERILSAISGEVTEQRKTKRSFSRPALVAVAAVLCVLFTAPAIIGITKLAGKSKLNSASGSAKEGVIALAVPTYGSKTEGGADASYDDYSAVFDKLSKGLVHVDSSADFKELLLGGYLREWAVDDMYYSNGAMMPESADAANVVEAPTDSDHSNTNTQVEGVDEADIIKTDGRYIYVLNSMGVTVLSADGASINKVAYINAEDMPKHHEDARTSFNAMYLNGGRLVIIASEYVNNGFYNIDYEELADSDEIYYGGRYSYWYYGASVTTVYVYDVEDASSPTLVNTLCQDGYYQDSRMIGSDLYVISDYMPNGFIVYDSPCTYVPCTYDGDGNCTLTPAEDICVANDDSDSSAYTYISAVDVDSPDDFGGTLAILGHVNTIYCSADNLYVTYNEYNYNEEPVLFDVDEYEGVAVKVGEGSNNGTLVTGCYRTAIYRVTIGGKQPVLAATGYVDGTLLNQFSMDEYNGYLRVAADIDAWSYIQVVEEDGDASTYYSYEYNDTSENALYVLDMGMNVVAKLDGMGVNEHIKSVRFMGDTGYIVTFRQTDPLYSLDLSDPTAPRVLGELHIPGFSEYLHSWNNDLLFGLGQMADEHTGGTQGLKISMFDVSDKSDVKELYTKKIEGVWGSSAEYNHKMILVSPEKGIIGFPAYGDTAEYYLYSFDEETGFAKQSRVKLGSGDDIWYYSDMTGMYIGDYFYVIAPDCSYERSECRVFVIDLNSYELVASPVFKN